ncbi:MAG: ribosome assembly cofactor RimP [Lewinellaceae bacterium]|nr:ribosome maturation factor [Saprospiraceae bacterium]MCB9313601.1 ribosome assembly cofactor RimP [Lewinellaceae bacterium]HRW75756.1 ribosome maturation factor [Saprospiraceae bacterium]
MSTEQLIRSWLEDRLQQAEWQSYFLIDIQVNGHRKVEVYLDGDEGITLEACRGFSRYLEGLLDEGGQLGDDYTLEVSSPGATAPLRLLRQYPKHVGRTLDIVLTTEEKVSGVLQSVQEDSIILNESIKSKGKKNEIRERVIPFPEIQTCLVKLSFK